VSLLDHIKRPATNGKGPAAKLAHSVGTLPRPAVPPAGDGTEPPPVGTDGASFTPNESAQTPEVDAAPQPLTRERVVRDPAMNDLKFRVLDDLVEALAPRKMSVISVWNVRGGITTTVRVTYP